MTQWKWIAIPILGILLLGSIAVSGLDPDPPLLETSLPNGYSLHSNGGWYGYVATPQGHRMASQFGVLDDEEEAWCEGFAWEGDMVVCERKLTSPTGQVAPAVDYFVLNTKNHEFHTLPLPEAESLWHQQTGKDWPELKTRYWFRTHER